MFVQIFFFLGIHAIRNNGQWAFRARRMPYVCCKSPTCTETEKREQERDCYKEKFMSVYDNTPVPAPSARSECYSFHLPLIQRNVFMLFGYRKTSI